MATLIHLDTHAVVWLAAGDLSRFGSWVPSLLQQRGCAISPMVQLELDYLHEIARIKFSGAAIVQDLAAKIGMTMASSSFASVVKEAAKLTWTRDPFDRIMCATARIANAPLLTKDGAILANERCAFWDHCPA